MVGRAVAAAVGEGGGKDDQHAIASGNQWRRPRGPRAWLRPASLLSLESADPTTNLPVRSNADRKVATSSEAIMAQKRNPFFAVPWCSARVSS